MEKKQREIALNLCGLRVREAEGEAADGQKSREIEGHAVVFGQRSVNLTPWSSRREIYEVMEPGSITEELLRSSDVVLTCFHDNSRILGRWTRGTGSLKLELDGKGLLIRCELPRTANGDEMLELIERGDISGMSFAYTADEEDSTNAVSYERTEEKGADGKEVWLRHVWQVNGLYDVTIAGHPAYQGTDVSKAEREAMDAEMDAKLGFVFPNEETEEEQKRERIAAEVEALRMAATF